MFTDIRLKHLTNASVAKRVAYVLNAFTNEGAFLLLTTFKQQRQLQRYVLHYMLSESHMVLVPASECKPHLNLEHKWA